MRQQRPRQPGRPPSPFERQAAEAVGKFARQAAAKLVEVLTTRRPPAAMSLPANNRYTDVEITLVGHEHCRPEYLDTALAEAIEFARPSLRGEPAVIVLKTNRPLHHLVLLQFKLTLECSAEAAQRDCDSTFQNMVDGDAVAGYAVEIIGVR